VTPVLVAALGFALCALAGTWGAALLCAERVPAEDGPVPRQPPVAAFVLAGGALGAALAWHGVAPLQLATLGLLVAALCAGAYADLRWGIVPDPFTLVPLAALVLSSALRGAFAPLAGALVVGMPFAVAALCSRGRGMGWGDVKLAALAGAVLGAQTGTLALAAACVVAFAVARLRPLQGRPLAFAPYLAVAIGGAMLQGTAL
jgi:prepilin signal peptidase PulO-like enzyme (type II secretory pathway)